ncbi:MAG: 30S ribosomal protein S13 [Candidatus Omnitrophica bacterium]|jgi:small subunit ribosomal protein S13|nr:30S ribosomal protein S13 [Candidatus Omnitrophota bacterium]MCF7896097.1 30S ribosomal protein S13 [Candidatus Omnitrophota bacterium]MCF7897690.1 30S ribosomal protein S13 [Candidatus Omnitrophota bacterium]MCF7909478.1 30S ribosomal protein S13 [Candidatus Omnitrophota bacterium]
MPRILGVDIPKNKKIKISLRYLYGVGPKKADEILNNTGIDPERKAGDLKEDETSQLARYIQSNYTVEGELRRKTSQDIRRLIEIKSYKGMRHKKGLPVRGQRTRCNARTKKGPKSRVGGKKR